MIFTGALFAKELVLAIMTMKKTPMHSEITQSIPFLTLEQVLLCFLLHIGVLSHPPSQHQWVLNNGKSKMAFSYLTVLR
jgi:hypothetical protein